MQTARMRFVFLIWLASAGGSIQAQNILFSQADSLKRVLAVTKDDRNRALVMTQIAEAYRGVIPDSSYAYAQRALDISRTIHYPAGEVKALLAYTIYFYNKGNLPQALRVGLKALDIARKNNLRSDQAFAMIRVGNVYLQLGDYRKALKFYEATRSMTKHTSDSFFHAVTFWLAADVYEKMRMPDSALYLAMIAQDTASKMNNRLILNGLNRVMANAYAQKGLDQPALHYYRLALGDMKDSGRQVAPESAYGMASYFYSRGKRDSAIFYARLAYNNAVLTLQPKQEFQSAALLSQLLEKDDPRESLRFLKISNKARDSVYSAEKIQDLESLAFQDKERQYDTEMALLTYQNKIRVIGFLVGLLLMLTVAIVLFRNNRHKQKVNGLLTMERNKLAETLSTLRSTQAQLIQSEKMASLGELTAGIAHEIQNPLNFVNNFSDLNKELIEELQEELKKGDMREASSIAENLRDNEDKINLHGRRADGIVKSMLQHSRSSSGTKELTDVNKLVDEYVRLAYHGYRARKKDFNVTLDIQLDPGVGSIPMVAQDIGRVLLNLLNNAFQAVEEKNRAAGPGYQPEVTVSTTRSNQGVEIRVEDNGPGIPDTIKEKIFQPFFTTKPTGQGTGLGLSLSYDIVKAHGGILVLESKKDDGTSLLVTLPGINNNSDE